MPKIVKEEQDDINVSVAQKEETFAVKWFKENAVNNTSDIKRICDLTARSAQEQFNLHLKKGNSEVYALVFHGTFMAILDFIRGKQKHYKNFTIEIFKSVNIGYTNNDDDDNEKVGNFMPVMEYIGINRKLIDDTPPEKDELSHRAIKWQQLNVKKSTEYYKEIQENAFKKLVGEYRTDLRTSEAVIPLFCIFLDHITSVVKIKYHEAEETDVSEVSMNVLGLFEVFYSRDEENNKEIIEFTPDIAFKLALKSDTVAGKD